MKFTALVKEIAPAVAAASKIAASKTPVAILQNLLITAEVGVVHIRATDLETTLERSFAAEVQEPGSTTVPAKLFAAYVAKLDTGTIEVDGSATRVGVKCGRSTFEFHALPAEEFPPLPPRITGASFSVPGKALSDALNAVIFAASDEEARGPILMGTLLEIADNTLTLVSTDGYRLARRQIALADPVEGWGRKVIPAHALADVARNLGDAEQIEVCALGERNQARFSAGNTSIIVRLVDGHYPNYLQVIPTSFSGSAVVNTEAFLGALRRAQLIAGDRANTVTVEVGDLQRVIVTASSNESGNAYEELESEQTGEGIKVSFNAKFLIEILAHVETPQVLMEFVGSLQPVAIKPTDETAQLHVLMPLRNN